jgi:predicted HTH domain antitoxin
MAIQKMIKEEREQKKLRKMSILRKSVPKTREERNELTLITLLEKIDNLTDIVQQQKKEITQVKKELSDKIEKLNCYHDQNQKRDSENSR